ncbi:MAG TPA: DUF2917 domain-containing protein [Rhodocyclaceae bacterium]|nr:DUF2917 domain-containing protein [Rhodocyclaceae bacterium]
MDTLTVPTRLTLEPRESMVLEHRSGVLVTCHAGCVWLTQYGDSRDLVLNAGQSHELVPASSTVLSSWRGAEVSIAHAPQVAGLRPHTSLFQRLAAFAAPRAGRRVSEALDGRVRVLRVG